MSTTDEAEVLRAHQLDVAGMHKVMIPQVGCKHCKETGTPGRIKHKDRFVDLACACLFKEKTEKDLRRFPARVKLYAELMQQQKEKQDGN